jgi:hypothetical protein
MSGFEVRTDALRTARSRLQELADDSTSARSYSQDYLEITSADDGHLKNPVDGVAEDVRARLATLFDTVDRLLRDSGTDVVLPAQGHRDRPGRRPGGVAVLGVRRRLAEGGPGRLSHAAAR